MIRMDRHHAAAKRADLLSGSYRYSRDEYDKFVSVLLGADMKNVRSAIRRVTTFFVRCRYF